MLRAIVDGQTDVQDLANLAKGRLVRKLPQLEEALLGKVRDHHRFLIQQHLNHLEFLEALIAVAHRILIALYHMFKKCEPFHDLGVNYLSHQSQQQHSVQRLHSQARLLGYQLELTPIN
jgi:hypothetical protein